MVLAAAVVFVMPTLRGLVGEGRTGFGLGEMAFLFPIAHVFTQHFKFVRRNDVR